MNDRASRRRRFHNLRSRKRGAIFRSCWSLVEGRRSRAGTDAPGLAMLIGSGFTLLGVVIVAKFMPAGEAARHGGGHGLEAPHASHSTPAVAEHAAVGD